MNNHTHLCHLTNGLCNDSAVLFIMRNGKFSSFELVVIFLKQFVGIFIHLVGNWSLVEITNNRRLDEAGDVRACGVHGR